MTQPRPRWLDRAGIASLLLICAIVVGAGFALAAGARTPFEFSLIGLDPALAALFCFAIGFFWGDLPSANSPVAPLAWPIIFAVLTVTVRLFAGSDFTALLTLDDALRADFLWADWRVLLSCMALQAILLGAQVRADRRKED